MVRSLAWMLCLERPHRLRFADALRARLMGDALGNVLPLGSFVVAEPAKPALIRDRLPLIEGFSSLLIENVFYSLSVVTFVSAGMLALLLSFSLTKGLRPWESFSRPQAWRSSLTLLSAPALLKLLRGSDVWAAAFY